MPDDEELLPTRAQRLMCELLLARKHNNADNYIATMNDALACECIAAAVINSLLVSLVGMLDDVIGAGSWEGDVAERLAELLLTRAPIADAPPPEWQWHP